MTPARLITWPLKQRAALCLATAAMFSPLLTLAGCNFGEPTAGGSSEVDNPVIALVDEDGARRNVTGSLGVYLSTQSPALNPAALLELQLSGVDSVVLSGKALAHALAAAGHADSARMLNLYLQAGDSSGAFLQNLEYDPASGSFARGELARLTLLKLTVSALVRAESVIKGGGDSGGVSRVIVPGSPFQTVLVDSVFVFEAIPPGVFPLHILTPDGTELPLSEPMDTQSPRHHTVNRDTTPVTRPGGPPPPAITVNAGEDRSVFLGAEAFLSAEISGVNPDDKRLSVLWRQLPPTNPGGGAAVIENRSKRGTRVHFPRTGAYTFVVTAVLGGQQVRDTVTIGVQSSSENPVFIEPGLGDTIHTYRGFRVIWQGARAETLALEFSSDSGATWTILAENIASQPGFNEKAWWPTPPLPEAPALTRCLLRLRRGDEVVAVSPRFVMKTSL